jgi:threonine dehydratase
MLKMAAELLDGVKVVTLDQAASAIRFVAERNRVICEGAAACAVATAMDLGQGRVAAIVSGGNIDLAQFAALTTR